MAVLADIEPKRVFHYFEELCAIPHGSGNTEAISGFLCSFAKEHGLKYIQDEIGNVVIYKNATPGYEDHPGIIIQGHMDMVAVSDSGLDMTSHKLKLRVDEDELSAEDTSLGGDDGIAVAYTLTILEADDLAHPAIEAVFTVDEETGMYGAQALDPSILKHKRLINIDSEEEGHILAGCAGGARVNISYKMSRADASDIRLFRICVKGCTGGHSGSEIHKGGANANILLGRILYEIVLLDKFYLVDIHGGEVDNAIPKNSEVVFGIKIDPDDPNCVINEEIRSGFDRIKKGITAEYERTDPGIEITFEKLPSDGTEYNGYSVFTYDSMRAVALILRTLPNGVVSMSADVPGLVETSLNLGVLCIDENDNVCMRFAVRSSVEPAKTDLIDRLKKIALLSGAEVSTEGVYPGWKYRIDSPLRDVFEKVYEDMYGVKPVTEAIHAGLECGFFAEKIPDIDCVSIGPDMYDVHTTSEHLSISSAARTWDYLCRVLAAL